MKQNKTKALICAAMVCVMGIHTGFTSEAASRWSIVAEVERPEKAETEAKGQAYVQAFQKAAEALEAKQEEERQAREAEEAKALEAAQSAAQGAVSTEVTAVSGNDADLLAALIYCDAGGEPYEGQVAVGAVVMNRVKSPSFPNSISEVIYQSGQFGPAVTGKLSRVMAAGKTTDSCYQAAQEAIAGNSPVGDAVYFGDGQNFGQLIGGHWFHS